MELAAGLADVADRLYRLTPGEFTTARNEAATAARSAGEGALATAVKGLRKPSTSAWLVNLLARDDPGRLDALFELGSGLRTAQDTMAGDELRRLSRERHQLIHDLVAGAGRLAAEQGQRVADAAGRELSATLDAAVADENAAAAVRSGRLIRALVSSGFDAVDIDGAVAVPEALPAPASAAGRPRLRSVKAAPPGRTAPPSSRQRAVDEARESAALAERAVLRAEAAVDSASSDVDAAQARMSEAEQALQAATAALADAKKQRTSATRDRDTAVRRRDAAQRALRGAEAAAQRKT